MSYAAVLIRLDTKYTLNVLKTSFMNQTLSACIKKIPENENMTTTTGLILIQSHFKEDSMQIKTAHVCPPIPLRDFDWLAYVKDQESSLRGWGKTQIDAICNLLEQIEEGEDE